MQKSKVRKRLLAAGIFFIVVLFAVLLFVFFYFRRFYISGTVEWVQTVTYDNGIKGKELLVELDEHSIFIQPEETPSIYLADYGDASMMEGYEEGDRIKAICDPVIATSYPPLVGARWILP